MKAIISPNEKFNWTWVSSWEQQGQQNPPVYYPIYSEVQDCLRIAEVRPDDQTFPVALPLYWTDCPDDCVADLWYFKDGICLAKNQDQPKP